MNDFYNKTDASVETFLEQIRQRNTKSNKTAVYRSIKKYSGCTKDDLINRLKLPHQTITSRISVLMDLGLVEVLATKQLIGNFGFVFCSQFKIQTDPYLIKKNQRDRRILKFKRLKKQFNSFSDMVPDELLESINTL